MKRFFAFLLCAALLPSPALAAEGDPAYLTCGELTATVGDYAQAVTEVGNSLLTASEDRGVPFFADSWKAGAVVAQKASHYSFAWDNTIDGITFDSYLAETAETLAFYRAWSESELAPQPTEKEFQEWKRDREADGGYLRFYYIPVKDAQTAKALQAALNKDEGRLEELRREYSAYPSAPLEEAGPAERFVPEVHALLQDAHGQWVVDEHDAPYERVYGVAKALPLTMDNYRELLLEEAWPDAIPSGDIRLAGGAEELDAVKLYEDWFERASEEGAVSLSFPERARISEEAVIAPAGSAAGDRPGERAEVSGNLACVDEGDGVVSPALRVCPDVSDGRVGTMMAQRARFSEGTGFEDVSVHDWFAPYVAVCVKAGLMQGTDKGFEPQKVLSQAEAVTLAARLGASLRGETIRPARPDEPWWEPYREYRFPSGGGEGGTAPAVRWDFLFMLYPYAYEENLLTPINEVKTLPDSDDGMILNYYNAGILTGVDKYGTFAGSKTLTRAEAAAMISRILEPELRLSFVPEDYSLFQAAYMEPGTVVFEDGTTAEAFLEQVNGRIAQAEEGAARTGHEFNWHYEESDGQTTLEWVKAQVLEDLGVTGDQGTQAYREFDYQVYYSRLISLTGKTLEPDYGVKS